MNIVKILFFLFIASLGLQGCWESKTKLIGDNETEKPDGASYILVQSIDDDSFSIHYMLELMPGPGNRYLIRTLDGPNQNIEKSYVQFYDAGSILGPDRYIIQMGADGGDGYVYYFASEADNYWNLLALKHGANDSPLSPATISGLEERAKNDTRQNFVLTRSLRIEKMSMSEATRYINHATEQYNRMVAEKAERAARDKAEVEELRRRSMEVMSKIELAVAQQGVEPTESEMSQAIRRSTAAGAFLNVSVKKLGNCRKAAEADYYCRYDYLGVNWGNFWKQNGTWYFKIANE